MLQVKNLTKIYKPKKGAEVRALDGVTLNFPETGMVFLLGKSGSGKSTLLNVCGGLDNPTDGEVIVKGRSSKDFAQSDFDSYRNTFVGFIFQEYNILNEFSVEDNIALALELQGKPKDKQAINALLEQVDLQGYAKRKPGTLSGGQKQRIAIARALIKSPEIIMADEPTGALDSATGKQVFDTLKKLSKDKLVIVVSHDRDFAEEYGDRIIELKDGKVISDISKAKEAQVALSANVNTVGEVLCIKNGADLTENDFEKIKAYLKGRKKDIVIASDEKDVDNFKKVSKISDDGSKEVFKETKEAPAKEYSKEDGKFISSRLPLRHAVKMGLSGLKSKPFRLLLTILLCTVAFSLFGLLTTLNFYDSENTFKETLAVTDKTLVELKKTYNAKVQTYVNGAEDYSYDTVNNGFFNDEELEKYKQDISPEAFGAVASYDTFNLRSVSSRYWQNSISHYAYVPEENALRGVINGSYPEKNGEIAITYYAAQMLYNCGTYDSKGENITLNSPEDIIGKIINISGYEYTVTGIVDTGAVDPAYDAILNGETDDMLLRDYETYMADTLHSTVFVSEARLSEVYRQYKANQSIGNFAGIEAAVKNSEGEYGFTGYGNAAYSDIENLDSSVKYYSITKDTVTAENEAIADIGILRETAYAYVNVMQQNLDYSDPNATKAVDTFYNNISGAIDGVQYIYDEKTGESTEKRLTEEERIKCIEELLSALKNGNADFTVAVKLCNPADYVSVGEEQIFNIVGVTVPDTLYGETKLYVASSVAQSYWEEQKPLMPHYEETFTEYTEGENEKYSNILIPYTYSEQAAESLWGIFENSDLDKEDISAVSFDSMFISTLASVDASVKNLAQTFLIIGLIFAVFAILLFSNFISASISQKTRDIGILRAVGARGTDVFKIFFSESFVIAIICAILSIIASFVVCGFINTALTEGLGATLLTFGPLSVLVLLISAFITAVVSTFLPVYNAARKKPVDSIRSL